MNVFVFSTFGGFSPYPTWKGKEFPKQKSKTHGLEDIRDVSMSINPVTSQKKPEVSVQVFDVILKIDISSLSQTIPNPRVIRLTW